MKTKLTNFLISLIKKLNKDKNNNLASILHSVAMTYEEVKEPKEVKRWTVATAKRAYRR